MNSTKPDNLGQYVRQSEWDAKVERNAIEAARDCCIANGLEPGTDAFYVRMLQWLERFS